MGYAVPQEPIPVLPEAFTCHKQHTHLGSPLAGAEKLNGSGDVSGVGDGDPMCVCPVTVREANYAEQALSNAGWELRVCPVGKRNRKLNVLAFNMGRLIARNWIGRLKVESCLMQACASNGLLKDDGIEQCRATLASGINAGMRYPYHNISPED